MTTPATLTRPLPYGLAAVLILKRPACPECGELLGGMLHERACGVTP